MSNPNSLDLWRARLEHFRQEEAKTSDPARRFEIQQEIQQATARIAELEALTPTLGSSSLANSPSVDRLRLVSQLASLASEIAALHNVPAQLDQLLTHLMQHGVGIQAQFIPQPFPPPDEPPAPPLGFIPRTALVQELLTQLTHVTWLNLTGAAGMGKTFAARLLAEHYGLTQTLWISLRSEHAPEGLARLLDLHLLRIASPSADVDLVQTYHLGGLPFSQLTRYTAHRLAATHLLVIDDIPDLLAFPQLRSKLSELARAVQEVGGKLLTTAQRSLPTAMTAPLDLSVADYPLPFMTPEDIEAMLTRMCKSLQTKWAPIANKTICSSD